MPPYRSITTPLERDLKLANQLLAEAADDPNEPVKVAKTQQAQQVLMNALSELVRACERYVLGMLLAKGKSLGY